MEEIFKLLQLDPSIFLPQEQEQDQIICRVEAPTTQTRSRHFPPHETDLRPAIFTCCGPYIYGAGHFVTFYMSEDCWYIPNPLPECLTRPLSMHYKLHRALREYFNSRNRPIPIYPTYRQLPRITAQWDAPLSSWSCGAFAMFATLHFHLGGKSPNSLPAHYNTRDDLKVLHRALLEWLILGSPPTSGPLAVYTKSYNPHKGHKQIHTSKAASLRRPSS